MNKWKITYRDNTPDEEVTSVDYRLGEVWADFADGSGVVTSIRTSTIERIDRV